MKKKTIAIIVGCVVFFSALGYIGYKKYQADKIQKANVESKLETESNNISSNESNKGEVKEDEYYGLPNGFVTSIKTKDQLRDGEDFYQANYINKDSNYDIEEVLKAKRVVENFIQALLSFNRENPTEYSNVAMQYMDKQLQENFKYELEDLKKTSGMNPYKLSKPTDVYSSEQMNTRNNDYLEFKTYVVLDNYDNRDQNIGNDMSPYYRVKLLPIDGEWKIVEYQME
ncbi:TPA: hypothetical protein ACF2DD_002949 [Clostridium perfringens]|uniref:hypothetical protein n=1 Tax=Clostridium perfringens TaxID=1502 RepID=UPI00077662D6|nr:hypothetical protein [Clostridium perfringens]AMN30803.1 hypothetical protein JFP55_pH0015 [Clostridium perfringens]